MTCVHTIQPLTLYAGGMNSADDAPALSDALAGKRVVLCVDRKSEELAAALARHGAAVEIAPALRTIPHADDAALLARTRDLIEHQPQMLVITTGVGVRGWFEAADAAGCADELRQALTNAVILARGPKGRGALQQAGLHADWVSETEVHTEVAAHLRTLDVAGKRVAVQHHGSGADGLDELLVELGADVVSVTVYRWGPAPDEQAVRRSVQDAAAGSLDLVVFTAAPGAHRWVEYAREDGVLEQLVQRAQDGQLVLAGVGPVTAEPLEQVGMPVLFPERMRMGAMIREILAHAERGWGRPGGVTS